MTLVHVTCSRVTMCPVTTQICVDSVRSLMWSWQWVSLSGFTWHMVMPVSSDPSAECFSSCGLVVSWFWKLSHGLRTNAKRSSLYVYIWPFSAFFMLHH